MWNVLSNLLIALFIIGFVSWHDCQSGLGEIGKYPFTFSVILGDVKCLKSGQKVDYYLNDGDQVILVQPLT